MKVAALSKSAKPTVAQAGMPLDQLAACKLESKFALSGLSVAQNQYKDIDQDFDILGQPTATPVKYAWKMYHGYVARNGSMKKGDLNLREAAPFAHHLWMVEHHLPRDKFTIRLWSGGCTEMLGIDLTGHDVDETSPVSKWPRLYRKVIATGVPVVLRNRLSESGKDFLTTEVAVLPLMNGDNQTQFILCPFSLVNDQL